jgi:hypothetical protein
MREMEVFPFGLTVLMMIEFSAGLLNSYIIFIGVK